LGRLHCPPQTERREGPRRDVHLPSCRARPPHGLRPATRAPLRLRYNPRRRSQEFSNPFYVVSVFRLASQFSFFRTKLISAEEKIAAKTEQAEKKRTEYD